MPVPTPPSTPPFFARVPLFWQLQLAGWGAFMLLSLPMKQLVYGSAQAALSITAYQLPLSLALTWLLRAGFRRLRLPERPPWASVALALAGCATIAALDVLVSLPFNHFLGLFGPTEILNSGLYFFRAAVYVMWTLAYFLIQAVRANRAQAFAAAVSAEKHRLELLRYQLNPGFLANSLATISHEIGQNPAAARAMATQLAEFYRNTVRQTDQQRPATIGDELALLRAYLEIERLRSPAALRVRFDVDPALLGLPLPPILLLPLVERALKEGRGTATQPLEIAVTIRRTPDDLVLLEVANTGRLGLSRPPLPGPAPDPAPDVRASLERHYPGRHRFTLSQDSLMARATVCLPLAAPQQSP